MVLLSIGFEPSDLLGCYVLKVVIWVDVGRGIKRDAFRNEEDEDGVENIHPVTELNKYFVFLARESKRFRYVEV